MSKIQTFSAEGGIAIGVYLLMQVCTSTLGWLWFRRKPTEEFAELMASVLAENISLFFYPIMEGIAGADGLALLALLDFPSPFFIYGAFPFIFRWASERKAVEAAQLVPDGDVDSSSGSEQEEEEEEIKDEETAAMMMETTTEEEEETGGALMQAEPSPLPEEEEEEEGNVQQQQEQEGGKCKAVWRRVVPFLRVFKSMALLSVLLGVLLGPVLRVGIPRWLDDLLGIGARGNMFCSMVLVGAMLDLSVAALRRHWLDVGKTLVVRYGCGIATTCFAYFVVGPHVSPLGRLVMAVGYLMPTPIASGSYAVQFGLDPAICALAVNVSSVISFFLTWLVLSIVPELAIINGNGATTSSSFSSSSSSSSVLWNGTAASSSLHLNTISSM